MSIEEKREQAAAYNEAVKVIETQKPKNEEYDISSNNGIGGKLIYYPLESRICLQITGATGNMHDYKISISYLESIYEALGKLLGKVA